jgi:dihydroxyacetone kinase
VLERIMERGGAEAGDKTVVDILIPVLEALEADRDQPASRVAAYAVERAREAVREGEGRTAKRGRAGWLGARSAGHQDPGSVALLRLLEEVAREF